MVGGGGGSFIGAVHRYAANLDGQIELVAGVFSRDADNNRETGQSLFLSPDRVYDSYETMMKAESGRDDKIDFVSIVTPNHLHVPVALSALAGGFHVMSDKPAALSLDECKDLAKAVTQMDRHYGLTHTYIGYPMVWQARHLVADGIIGRLRKVYVEYPQGWLGTNLETDGNKQAAWRTDPARAGRAGCVGDIGSHAHNLVEFISGSGFVRLLADLRTHVEGRLVDDDATILFELDGGASGVLTASQVASGEENSLRIRVYGDKGSLEWQQMQPNTLIVRRDGAPNLAYRAGADQDELCDAARARCRLPAGHPEGYLEAFGNLYRGFATAIGNGTSTEDQGVPGLNTALRGMGFVDTVLNSADAGGVWTDFSNVEV